MLGAPPGKPPHDYSYMRTVMKSAMIEDDLIAAGVRGVERAWAHESGGGRLLIAVSISQKYAGHARQVGYALHALPEASAVPWHRVLNARGALSLRRDSGGEISQRLRLEQEGVRFDAGGRIALERVRWRPSRNGRP